MTIINQHFESVAMNALEVDFIIDLERADSSHLTKSNQAHEYECNEAVVSFSWRAAHI